MNKYWLLIVLVLCFVNIKESESFDIQIDPTGPVGGIISNLTFTFPLIEFYYEGLNADVNITDLVCVDVSISNILGQLDIVEPIIFDPNDPDKTKTVQVFLLILEFTKLNINCAGEFSYKMRGLLPIGEEGNITFSIGNETKLNTMIGIHPPTVNNENEKETYNKKPQEYITDGSFKMEEEDDGQLLEASLRDCQMNVTVTFVNTTSDALNSIRRALGNEIAELVPKELCESLNVLVSNNVTALLNNAALGIVDILDQIEDEDPDELFNSVGSYSAFGGAVGLWIILAIVYGTIEYLEKRKKNNFVHFEDVGDDGPYKIPPGERTRLFVPNDNNDGEEEIVYTEVIKEKEGITTKQVTSDYESIAKLESIEEQKNQTMVLSSKIPIYWRYPMVLVLLLNIALFASSTISVAASIYIYITVGGEVSKSNSIYTFTLISSVVEMWEAGVWPLSLLIGVTSGIWPYVKLVLMFFAWITPPKLLPAEWRGRLLHILDFLGKWSLIDAYVLVLFLEAFRIHISLFSDEVIQFDMVGESHYAFFSYLGATMLSLFLTHVILYWHHHMISLNPPDHSNWKASMNHIFSFFRGKFISFSYVGAFIIVFILGITTATVVYGYIVEAFSFSYKDSLVGAILDFTGESSSKNYSIFSLAEAIPYTSLDTPNEFGIRVIQITFYIFAVAIPLAYLATLMFIWVVPLTTKIQHNLFVIIEVLNAWSAIDVFIVAIIVALLELEQFSEFIVKNRCDDLNKLLANLDPSASNPTCLNVTAHLEDGSWILLAATIIFFIVSLFLLLIISKSIKDRIRRDLLVDRVNIIEPSRTALSELLLIRFF